jgi:hypothetical protein
LIIDCYPFLLVSQRWFYSVFTITIYHQLTPIAKTIPVSDIILDESQSLKQMKPIAADIGSCIRIIKALLNGRKKRITIETAIISSIKVPLTDSIAFNCPFYHKDVLRRPSGNPFRLLSFCAASITLSAFSP